MSEISETYLSADMQQCHTAIYELREDMQRLRHDLRGIHTLSDARSKQSHHGLHALQHAMHDYQRSAWKQHIRHGVNTLIPQQQQDGSQQLSGAISQTIQRMMTRWFSTGRAIGGKLGAGTPYMVGERGPEMFVPHSGGHLHPHGKGVHTPVHITMHVHTPDTQGFRRNQGQIIAEAAQAMRRAQRYL
jgi:hypothetical protein